MKLNKVRHPHSQKIGATDAKRPGAAKKAHGVHSKDGFHSAAKRPVDLGKAPPASRATDGEFVKGLYRDLLGREPDAEGFHSHMRGLENGMTRDEIRQVFLSSPEFRGKAPAGKSTGPGQVAGSAQTSATESFRQLIAADIKLAGNREATDADYAYWLPKLQGPCDSGFVTSGQMTGTEYWHRRLLGWQAGGSDMAVGGPYAGSPDAHGPVPSATDMVPSVPSSGLAAPAASSALVDKYRQLIAADIRLAGGREANDVDYNYWLPKLMGPCDSGFVTSGQMTGTEYWHRRLLGWQAGGADMAIAGPYAGSPDARGPVPSAIDMVGQFPES